MDLRVKTALGVIGGTVMAGVYFWTSEKGVPAEANCSYLAPASTDVFAWGVGAALIYLGFRHNSPMTAFFGASIATLHVAQFATHRVAKRRSWRDMARNEAKRTSPEALLAHDAFVLALGDA